MVCQYAVFLRQDKPQSNNDGFVRLDDGFAICDPTSDYVPRNPADSVLYSVVAEHLETFLARQRQRERIVPLLAELYAASVQGRITIGPRAGSYLTALGSEKEDEGAVPSVPRCAAVSGFSLHANVCIPAKARHQLENLCRYTARPAVATERLSVLPNGWLLYRLRHPWRNGATHVVFEPLEFVGKLAALVPPPMFNLVRYHGILSSAARGRSSIVPFAPEAADPAHHDGCSAGKPPAHGGEKFLPGCCHLRNYTWAELMKRVWEVDVLECDRCGGRMRILAAINRPEAIKAILECLGLPSRAPPISPALRDKQDFLS